MRKGLAYFVALLFVLSMALAVPEDLGHDVVRFDGSNHTRYTNPGFDWRERFSFNTWIKPDDSGILASVGYIGSDGDDGAFQMKYTDDNGIKISPNNVKESLEPDIKLNQNQWNMVTITVRNKNVSIFVDGNYIDSKVFSFDKHQYKGAPLLFGRRAYSSDINYEGVMDKTKYYDRKR
jgi:hypothetical protein